MQDILKAEADPDINPMTAIGEGAAIAAGILSGEIVNSDFFVCLEHALGTFTFDPTTGLKEFSTIIRKGTKLPARASGEYIPIVTETEAVTVEVVEGDPDNHNPDFTTLKEWNVKLKVPYEEGSNRAFQLQYDYDIDGIVRVQAIDNDSGHTILDDGVSYGVATDKKKLKQISDRAKSAVSTGTVNPESSIKLDDPEATKLIEQAQVKVIPFLDESESGPIVAAVAALNSATPQSKNAAKAELKRLLLPFSYLF